MTVFLIVGPILAIVGIILLLVGIRGGPDARPRNMAMLIGGTMLAAFGIILTGFVLVYTHTAPLDMNAGSGS